MSRGASISAVLVALLAWAGCGSDAGHAEAACAIPAEPDADVASPWPDGKYISVDEVHARLQAQDLEMLLVNVVDVQYYDLGFIPGSLKIPWDTLAGRLGELDPARHVVLYCRKGVRSESAYTTLVDNAFPFVWVMEGGIERWSAAGYSTVAE
jgi:rhodanese-related sulfurtransferase